ncbi:hypothetical protein Rsub_04922 [Raphidocelis subcapitata]|uniref:Fungal lipase-type domain-containing protein n=1 Tax=Raphidocelis subcapitata TaxID=307507 RepID=A0A2V0P3M9_9CHLO|nr:hypothetical protein Rsub_04922 [Raphidocelis subcapitata]|eukprot:GBF91817.1 hypothetical protein Rsub_04922 [Raphidocelis subcapitata]
MHAAMEEDLHCAAVLCELAYRSHAPADELRRQAAAVCDAVALSRCELGEVSKHAAGDQRFVVSHGPHAVYVAFQGTKQLSDWAANLRVRHTTLWQRDAGAKQQRDASAHGGFGRRSRALPLFELRDAARAAGKRLVLCGHSLGGAVATLCAVTLLRESQTDGGAPGRGGGGGGGDPGIRCIAFAAPPCANDALAAEAAAAGWDRYISNYVLPEDPVVPMVNRLLRARAAAASRFWHGSDGGGDGDGDDTQGDRDGASGGAAGAGGAPPELPAVQMMALERAEAAAAAWLRFESGCASDDDGGCGVGQLQPLRKQHAFGSAAGAAVAAAALAVPGNAAAAAAQAKPGALLPPQGSVGRRAQRHGAWPIGPLSDAAAAQLLTPQPSLKPAASLKQAASLLASGIAACGKQRLQPARASPPVARPGGTAGAGAPAAGRGGAALRWAGRALGAGLRVAALAAPRLLPAAVPVLGTLLPAAAGIEILGSAILMWAVPRNCPLGSQWVLSADGLAPADRPLCRFPRAPQALGLKQLGGLFPGHRMIAYRTRIAQLSSRGGTAASAAGAPAARAPAAAPAFAPAVCAAA